MGIRPQADTLLRACIRESPCLNQTHILLWKEVKFMIKLLALVAVVTATLGLGACASKQAQPAMHTNTSATVGYSK